ncbi:porin [Idiomarina seosinensis]|uniref:Porin n=1 Tax=Idiomarina seosinensis TaxID=281739 RepID=A0A432ZBM0_9GAMM|nr:porin [Idiomarina seosinensis]RUO75300.1 porin [Idiomarina seosinensis]
MKQLLGLASLVLLSSLPVQAQGSDKDENTALTVYGRANVSFQSNDEGDGSYTDLVSNSSRFGLKGFNSLNDDLEVFYQIEFGIDLADFDEGDDAIGNRNQVVGLRGSFGEIMLGRYDTFLKDSQGKIDEFTDYEADLKSLFRGENRPDNTVTYYSPSFNNFSVGLTYIASGDESEDDGVSFGVLYGDAKLKKTKFYAALAIDRDVANYDIEQFSAATKLGNTRIGAALQQFQRTDGLYDSDGYLISAAHPYKDWVFKAQYQAIDDGEDRDSSISVGADYFFNGNTRVYTWYTGRQCDIAFYESRGCGASPGVEQDYLAIGIRHDFSW